jgi:zinc D-Ala-D-Ala dipeptidase
MARLHYHDIQILEQHEPLVELSRYPFHVVPVYHLQGWSDCPLLFLREQLADKLDRVQREVLKPRGWRWVVYDAWRPRQVQAAVFQHYWDAFSASRPELGLDALSAEVTDFVSFPADWRLVPSHTTGGSVDLGLWDDVADELVPLGAKFDEFVPACANDYYEQPGRSQTLRDRRRVITQALRALDVASDALEHFHKDYGNQKWAQSLGRGAAHYGEVLDCRIQDGRVLAAYSQEFSSEDLQRRVASIASGLSLSHPAEPPLALKDVDLLVRKVVGFADLPF